MCAAPGGKSLALAQRLFRDMDSTSQLVCNEFSAERRKRLQQVLRSHLPSSLFTTANCNDDITGCEDNDCFTAAEQPSIRITGLDGTRYSSRNPPESFDKVLVDAPCSSERHLIHNRDGGALEGWTEGRTRSLAQKQCELLREAIRMCRPGGLVVYATCSLSPMENDGVIERVCCTASSRSTAVSSEVRVLSKQWRRNWPTRPRWAIGEPTEYGWIVLPDNGGGGGGGGDDTVDSSSGWGPLYFALIQRRPL
jgi:16S rRNA C967 or C1407 C5-methylase (RsmB/RsmF family)